MGAGTPLIMWVSEVCVNEAWHAPQWHCRAWARAVESGPGGQELRAERGSGWKRCLTRAHRKGESAH
jgi:hypothetical protein